MDDMKLRYVYEDTDRHGNVRRYFWRGKGHKKVRLKTEPGTPEFAAEYAQALSGTIGDKPSSQIAPRSWRWLCTKYMGSREFARLDPSTQRVRRKILEGTFNEPVHKGSPLLFADVPVRKFTSKGVRALRDRKEGPEAANGRVKAIRQVFKWGVDTEEVSHNPARDVPYIKTNSDGWHTWSVQEVEQYEAKHLLGTRARLALDLLLYGGERISDAVTLGRQHCHNGWIRFTAFKGRNKNPVVVEIPILPPLQKSIDATPNSGMTFIVTEFGKPFSAKGFSNRIRKWCDEAGLPHCSAHGLRKAGATIAAENGATEYQLMAIFGWLTPKEAARYTRAARKKKMAEAGMPLLMRNEE